MKVRPKQKKEEKKVPFFVRDELNKQLFLLLHLSSNSGRSLRREDEEGGRQVFNKGCIIYDVK